MQDTVYIIKSSIYGHGRGWCFTPKDFIELDKPLAIRKALSRLHTSGFIRRIGWGLYEYPRKHHTLGQLPSDISEVAKAIARSSQTKILPSGAYAANLLGLSEQVPGQVVFLTDGPSHQIKIGKRELIFKRTTIKNMSTAGTMGGILIQALKHLGKDHIDPIIIKKIKHRFSKNELIKLKKQSAVAPQWIRQIINDITNSGAENG